MSVFFLYYLYCFYTIFGFKIFLSHINKKTTYTDPRLAFAVEEKRPGASTATDFKQKYDASSTAQQVLLGRDLTGSYYIVTGANSGIGKCTKLSYSTSGINN